MNVKAKDLAPRTELDRQVERAAAELPRWWFTRARPDLIAAEIELCTSPLQAEEVRTLVRRPSADPSICLLSMVGCSDANLLASAAARFAVEELLVTRAEMVTWQSRSAQLIRTTLTCPGSQVEDSYWHHLATRLEWNTVDSLAPEMQFEPRGPVDVSLSPVGGDTMVIVEAPHRVGLLWATCDWLSKYGCVIRQAQTESSGNVRQSAYLVSGAVDTAALAVALCGTRRPHPPLTWPVRYAWRASNRLLNRTSGRLTGTSDERG